jgi:hypothetical protein
MPSSQTSPHAQTPIRDNKSGSNRRSSTGASDHVRRLAARFAKESRSVRVPIRHRLMYWLYYMGLAHKGKSVYSSTRDAQYADGFFKRGYDKYSVKINKLVNAAAPQQGYIDVPSFERGQLTAADLELLTKQRVPYLIRNGAEGMALKEWDLEYLEGLAGDCTGPINEATDAPSDDLDLPTKAHHYYDFRIGTLSEVADSIRSGGNKRFTVAEDVMHANDGQLLKELDLPQWEQVTGWDWNQNHWLRKRLFIGKIFSAQLLLQPESAFSLWHAEPGDGYFVLGKGVKDWTLVHPIYTAAMRPRVKKTTNYTGSNIDIRESESVQKQRGFESYLSVPKVRIRMEPGDMLRVPNNWWHTVETLPGDYTLAASMRVEPGPNLVGLGFIAMRIMDKRAHAILKAYERDGRISDELIGLPRKSRSVTEELV